MKVFNYINDVKFVRIIPLILDHEGGYVDDETDDGGATNFGISTKFLQSIAMPGVIITKQDIQNLTPDDAKELYYEYFWFKTSIYQILDLRLCAKVLDMAVNEGASQAIKFLQRASNSLNGTDLLSADGQLGPISLKLINSFKIENQLLYEFQDMCDGFYRYLADINPNDAKDLKGWLARVADMGDI